MKNHISDGQFRWHYFKKIFHLMQCLNKNCVRYTQKLCNRNWVGKENLNLLKGIPKAILKCWFAKKQKSMKLRHTLHCTSFISAYCFLQSISLLLSKQKYFRCCFHCLPHIILYEMHVCIMYYIFPSLLLRYYVWLLSCVMVIIRGSHIFDSNSI